MSVHGICPKCLDYAFDDELCKCLGCGYRPDIELVEENLHPPTQQGLPETQDTKD